MVLDYSAHQIRRRKRQISPAASPRIERRLNERTIRELAEEIGMPQPTLYTWIQEGPPILPHNRRRFETRNARVRRSRHSRHF